MGCAKGLLWAAPKAIQRVNFRTASPPITAALLSNDPLRAPPPLSSLPLGMAGGLWVRRELKRERKQGRAHKTDKCITNVTKQRLQSLPNLCVSHGVAQVEPENLVSLAPLEPLFSVNPLSSVAA